MTLDPEIAAAELPEEEAAAFGRLLEKLRAEHNFDFREYKQASLVRRVHARMSQVHVADFDAYARLLATDEREAAILFNTILINVTGFFRDPEAWVMLGEDVMPRLVDEAALSGTLRIWSAGSSTGEEAYSLAILLAERLGPQIANLDVKIYATDVDEDALATARQALYRLEHLKDLPEGHIARYFTREGQLYRFRRDLRRLCIFGRHNLVNDPPLSRVDLLVCRNVLIYFKSNLQDRLLPRFYYAIREGGFLFLGKSESLLARSPWFVPVHARWRIFRRTAHAAMRPDLSSHHELPAETAPAAGEAPPAGLDLLAVVDALPGSAIVIDAADTVLMWNGAAEALYGIRREHAVGRRFRDLDISYRAEGLRARIEDVKRGNAAIRLDDVVFTGRGGQTTHANITIQPLLDARRRVFGILVSAVDVTAQAGLRQDFLRVTEQHEMAAEELQSANEELETTNEELQSTNEELETTNEELQSTNTELMTTVDELQSANTMLGERTVEVNRLALYHASVVENVQEVVIVLDHALRVTTWNGAAERLWNIPAPVAIGRDLTRLQLGAVGSAVKAAVERMREGRAEQPVELSFSTADGRPHTLRLIPLSDASGELHGVLATAVAATETTGPP